MILGIEGVVGYFDGPIFGVKSEKDLWLTVVVSECGLGFGVIFGISGFWVS